MKNCLDKCLKVKYFYILYLIFFVGAGICLLLFSKAESHLWLNRYHTRFFDVFFYLVTQLGNGWFIMIVAAILFFIRYRYAFGVIVTFALSGIMVQIVKHISDIPRPVKYFEGIASLPLVDGVQVLTHYSFPSGHSASAFALCLSLAFIVKNKVWQFILFTMALIIAYSRVYLSQHFLVDIWAGSALGVLITSAYWCFEQKISWSWMDDSLVNKKHISLQKQFK